MNAVHSPLAQVSLLHVHGLSFRSVANHPMASPVRFLTLPLSDRRFPAPRRGGLGFVSFQQTRHPIWPNRVRHYPTDRIVTSRCFGPHLVVTPFRLVFRPESACLTRTLTSLAMHARRRTGSGFQPLVRECPQREGMMAFLEKRRPRFNQGSD